MINGLIYSLEHKDGRFSEFGDVELMKKERSLGCVLHFI
jgi:hypothetical protein